MKTDATTPVVETSTATPTLPPSEAGPQTYEDCITIIEKAKAETDPANIKAALSKLHGFFQHRVGKRKDAVSKDGGDAVRKAVSGTRSFNQFQVKPLTPGV
jgi:hypothetical protein